jgi:hypothetical protein
MGKGRSWINEMGYTTSGPTNPSAGILATALIVGGVSSAAGFVRPLFFSGGNLGPLLGILTTGLVGTLSGALIGIVRSALHAGVRKIRTELWWLGSVWVLSLLGFLREIGSVRLGALSVVGLQGLVIATGAFLLGRSKVRTSLPAPARRYGGVMLSAAILIMLSLMFPPVTEPWWVPEQLSMRAAVSGPLPKFAFLLDSRFDASRHFPEFAVHTGRLFHEWIVIGAIAGLVCLFIAVRSRRPNVRQQP